MSTYAIVNLEPIRRELAIATSIQQVKKIRDKAEAVRGYLRQQGDAHHVQVEAGLLKIEAERRLGELLKDTTRAGNPQLSNGSTIGKLPDGISRDQSSSWQKIAAIPEPDFREELRVIEAKRIEPTTAHFVRKGKTHLREEHKKQALKAQATMANGRDHDSWQIVHSDWLDGLARHVHTHSVRLCFMDPPYNNGTDYGNGTKADQRPDGAYLLEMTNCIVQLKARLTADGSLWVLISNEYAAEFGCILKQEGFHLRSWITWYETFGVNCSNNFNQCSRQLFYCVMDPKHFVFHAEAANRPSDRQAKYADKRADPGGKIWDNVWQIPRLVGTAKERIPDFPTQLPLALLLPIIGCASDPGDLIVDPFSGSATTGAVALTLGRRYLGIEKNQLFAELSRQRLKAIGH